jgi:hypothetical protein
VPFQGYFGVNVEGNWQVLCQQGGDRLKEMLGIEFKVGVLCVNERKLDKLCAKLGVNGIVFGHDGHAVNFQMLNVNDRVFCLDMHKGDNGFMVFNGAGIRFNALANSLRFTLTSLLIFTTFQISLIRSFLYSILGA